MLGCPLVHDTVSRKAVEMEQGRPRGRDGVRDRDMNEAEFLVRHVAALLSLGLSHPLTLAQMGSRDKTAHRTHLLLDSEARLLLLISLE